MKRFIFYILICFPLFVKAQAHLGSTEREIRQMHPDKYFKVNYTDKGVKYITTDFDFGTFAYYFDPQTSLSELCVQIPFNTGSINAQAEIYNKRYTIKSETSWTAYLDDGGILNIKLVYDSEYRTSVFIYTEVKD